MVFRPTYRRQLEPASTRLLVLVGALPASSGLNSTPCGILKNLKFAIGQVRPQSERRVGGMAGRYTGSYLEPMFRLARRSDPG